MTDPMDPPRLADSPAAGPEGLRDLLGAARRDVGSDQQLARLADRLGPLLAPPAAAAAVGMSALAKLGAASVALIVAGGGAWMLSAPQPGPPPAPVSPAAPRSAEQPPAAATGAAPAATAAAVVAPDPAPAASSRSTDAPPSKPAPSVAFSEAEVLEQARRALKGDPARALTRANEHRSRFPRGVLAQEREVIAIQALRQMGRSAEAERRAEAFEKAFPGSPFQRKLKASP